MDEKLLTVEEAACRFRTTERFPRRLIAERRIRFVKLGGHHVRIPESAVNEFIAANMVNPIEVKLKGGRVVNA